MGFRLDRTYRLIFEGALDGAEVHIKATSVGTILELRNITEPKQIADLLAAHLIGWNLEDADGTPIPTTPEGILSLEQVVLERIGQEWYKAATGVTAPLDAPNSMESSLNNLTELNDEQ